MNQSIVKMITSLCCFSAVSTIASIASAQSTEFADNVVTLPAMIVEASRIQDPAAAMRGSLDEVRARLAAPSRINLHVTPAKSWVASAANGPEQAPTLKFSFGKQRSRRLL